VNWKEEGNDGMHFAGKQYGVACFIVLPKPLAEIN